MELIEKRLKELEALVVPQTRQPDFDAFWEEAVRRCREQPLNARGEKLSYPIAAWEVEDLVFDGLDKTPVYCWRILPPEAQHAPVPAAIVYHGAGGDRCTPSAHAAWLAMGMAVVAPDFRMQGGLTGSQTGFRSGSGEGGCFELGLEDKYRHYFYHTWTDCLRAIEIAIQDPRIDRRRVLVTGGSQGGAASLAMAALHPEVSLCCADVPSNCWIEKRIYDATGGAGRVTALLRRHPDLIEQAHVTLSYFDNLNLAERIRCPTLISVGLKDTICPPETIYAACNRIHAPKEIVAYPFGDHGGGGLVHAERKLAFVRRHFFS